ncbi:methyltransferase [Desulforhopalus sp. IMCC35007]|uniref:methyltransferase n=1 Tax=Desulforhopalus sp. IMCC35007 TaxID=2569543 RepID=UPI0010AE720B|nr:methyltransferase [Desulforhopalus sp. IMCC35007]TKB08414.1 methyltransferase domain-containing protein [Desulforhopalus sp. IMCC35007]
MPQNWNVGTLLSISSGYWRGCTLQAAVRLRIFSLIGQEKAAATEIAEKASTDSRATGLLLDALTAMGLLEKEQEHYANTPFTSTYLLEDSKQYMGHIILHHHHLLDGWAQLDKAVCTGKKVERRSYGASAERESFLLGMFNLAAGIAPQIAENIDLNGRRRLLDLGGGPGTYSIQFCLKNPDLRAVIFDRPTTEPIAQKVVASFQLEDRISFEPGDFTISPFPAPLFDVAWLSHILHSNSYKQCEQCIQKTVDSLEPGGLILIHDFILTAEKDGPEFPALFALNMLVGTERGRSYSVQEITRMMEKAGITQIRHHTLRTPNDSSILSGIKSK